MYTLCLLLFPRGKCKTWLVSFCCCWVPSEKNSNLKAQHGKKAKKPEVVRRLEGSLEIMGISWELLGGKP